MEFVGPSSDYVVDVSHMFKTPPELHDELKDLDKVQPAELVTIAKSLKITEEQTNLWVGYSGEQRFANTSDVYSSLETLVSYTSFCSACPEDTKRKLKAIIQVLAKEEKNPKFDCVNIILLLATNGGVCNVQKEVGIRTAYAAVTGNLKVSFDSQSLESCILRLLYTHREVLCEKVYLQSGGTSNTHYLIPFRNQLGEKLGLKPIPDPDALPAPLTDAYEKFMKMYTVEEITRVVGVALNDKPRTIHNDIFVEYMKKNKPKSFESSYDFLEAAYDEDTGLVKTESVLFALHKLGVIRHITEEEKVQRDRQPSVSTATTKTPATPEKTRMSVALERVDDKNITEVGDGERTFRRRRGSSIIVRGFKHLWTGIRGLVSV